MSHDNHNTENNAEEGQPAPLHRFLQDRKHRNGDATSTTPTANAQCRESRLQQAFACRSRDSTERRPRRASRSDTDAKRFNNDTKSQHRRRRRNRSSKGPDTARSSHHSLSRLAGYCRCGAEAEAPYFERCENCFAEDSARWDGKDRSAKIHF